MLTLNETFLEHNAFIRKSSNSDVDADGNRTDEDSSSTTSNNSDLPDEENVHHIKFLNNNGNNQHSFPQANWEPEHDFEFVEVNDENAQDNNINDMDEQSPINFAHGISPVNGMHYYNNCQSCMLMHTEELPPPPLFSIRY